MVHELNTEVDRVSQVQKMYIHACKLSDRIKIYGTQESEPVIYGDVLVSVLTVFPAVI